MIEQLKKEVAQLREELAEVKAVEEKERANKDGNFFSSFSSCVQSFSHFMPLYNVWFRFTSIIKIIVLVLIMLTTF